MGGVLSLCELMAVLYGSVMDYDPQNPGWEDRDKVVLSKATAGRSSTAPLPSPAFSRKKSL